MTNHIELEGLEAYPAQQALNQEIKKVETVVMNGVNTVKEGVSGALDWLGDKLQFTEKIPKEAPGGQQKGIGVNIYDEGKGGPDNKYAPSPDPNAKNFDLEKAVLDALGAIVESPKAPSPEDIGQRMENVATGMEKTNGAIEAAKDKFLCLGIILLVIFSCDRNRNLILKYPSGKVKAIWTYERDTLNGLKQIFWENGHRNSILLYKNGKEHGRFKMFYENGFIARAGEFINGKLHGYHYKYSMSDSGQVITEEYIINANNKHYYFYIKNFDAKGVLVDHQRFLIIELNEKNVTKSVVFKYAGDVLYDSIKIVSGKFSNG